MTTRQDFDDIARAWLDLMPDELPDRVFASVVEAVEATPQMRRSLRRASWRFPTMNRLSIAMAGLAVAVIAVAGGVLVLGGNRGPGVGASTASPESPVPTPSAVASGGGPSSSLGASSAALPPALVASWVGPPRSIPTVGSSTQTVLVLTDTALAVTGRSYSAGGINAILQSDASLADASTVTFVTIRANAGCAAGDRGIYRFSLSPGGTVLTLTAVQDACSSRPQALAGDWQKIGCTAPADACLGDLEAGLHASQFIDVRLADIGKWQPAYGAMTYTVPAGWSNGGDYPRTFNLVPGSWYATHGDGSLDTLGGIYLVARPTPVVRQADCAGAAITGADLSVRGLVDRLRHDPALTVGAVTAVTIGGRAGTQLDLAVAPTWTTSCPGASSPVAQLFVIDQGSGDPASPFTWDIVGGERHRLTLLDIGGGAVVAIDVAATDPTAFDPLATAAAPIVQSFRFR